MRKLITIFLLMFATTAMAATDIVATYKYQDGTMVTIVTRDKDHVRMDTSATTYMLIKDETVYSVSKNEEGQWMVMDLGQLKTSVASKGVTSLFGGGQDTTQEVEYMTNYKKTGQKEKIAGYTGVVYNVEVKEGDTIIRHDEVVLCTHSDIKKVNEAWSTFGEKMNQAMGDEMSDSFEKATQEAKELGYGGMLRYGDEMRLDSLKKMSLDVSYYQVPVDAQPIQMGQMPDMTQMQQQYGQQQQNDTDPQQQYEQQQQQQYEQQEQGVAGKRLEKDAQDVGQAARQETKDQTINEVKEGVRSIFKSIFD